MKEPLVTIVTISYNSGNYIKQAIESVLAQSFRDFEYLISDDCSSDSTWDIIKKYKDPRIRAWRNTPNLGEYPNRNKTLYEAKGKYIIWIDGDDIFYPHGLEFMVKMLDAFPLSAMACAFHSLQYFIYPYELSPEEAYKHEFLGFPMLQTGFTDTLFKVDKLIEIGGLSEKYIAGDTYTKRLLAQTNHTLIISKDVSWWRMTPGQASQKLKTLKAGIMSYNSVLELLSKHTVPIDETTKTLIIKNQKISLITKLINLGIKKGNFKGCLPARGLMKLSDTLLIFEKLKRDYSKKQSKDGPLMLPFDRNPFSSTYLKNNDD
jgi:glycosyltransferase involved in cell wall biosynthesis